MDRAHRFAGMRFTGGRVEKIKPVANPRSRIIHVKEPSNLFNISLNVASVVTG